MIVEAVRHTEYRRHHMGHLLHRMGALLPLWLNGPDLVRECRESERLCWRELGYSQSPVFESDLPPFLMTNADGDIAHLSSPTDRQHWLPGWLHWSYHRCLHLHSLE